MPFSKNNNMEGGGSRGVRKGAWSEEEDLLLRKCIEMYGEGKWRQVPFKAGLNRCRKSCRLRWLNYLRPNIKRGEFTTDEVDLIVRMHKLLGNRWSLIAGRLPGRTANDIKNYCNTHLKNMLSSRNNKEVIKPSAKKDRHQYQMTSSSKVLKPLPRTFSKNSKWFKAAAGITSTTTTNSKVTVATNIINTLKCTNNSIEMPLACATRDALCDQFSSESNKLTPHWLQSILQLEVDDDQDHQAGNDGTGNNEGHGDYSINVEIEASSNQENDYWKDLYLDDNLWRLLGEEQEMIV